MPFSRIALCAAALLIGAQHAPKASATKLKPAASKVEPAKPEPPTEPAAEPSALSEAFSEREAGSTEPAETSSAAAEQPGRSDDASPVAEPEDEPKAEPNASAAAPGVEGEEAAVPASDSAAERPGSGSAETASDPAAAPTEAPTAASPPAAPAKGGPPTKAFLVGVWTEDLAKCASALEFKADGRLIGPFPRWDLTEDGVLTMAGNRQKIWLKIIDQDTMQSQRSQTDPPRTLKRCPATTPPSPRP